MSEGILRQITRTTDPAAAPSGYVDFYYKNGQYHFIDDAGTITIIPMDSESIQDVVGALINGGTGIDAVYNDGANILTIDVDSSTYNLITSAVQVGDNVSDLVNDAGYITSTPPFGTQAEDFIDSSNVTITSSTPSAAYAFTSQSNPSGRYRIAINFHHEPASTGNNDIFTLRVDGVQIGLEYEDEGKDSGGDIRRIVNLVGYYQHVTTGTFDIQLYASRESGTQIVHGCQAEVWRIS